MESSLKALEFEKILIQSEARKNRASVYPPQFMADEKRFGFCFFGIMVFFNFRKTHKKTGRQYEGN